ncbi:MAG: hypothetical protein Q7R75_01590 [bacterium]|nr:hypothetical protein [bacterium]
MQNFLLNFAGGHHMLVYSLVFLAMFIEGEVVLILSGVLIKTGRINFLITLVIVFIAVVLHDIAFWWMGKKSLETKREKFLFFKISRMESFLNRIRTGNGLCVFVSKFVWSVNRVVLFATGYIGLPFKKLIRFSVPTALIWSMVFISLGYVFADQTEILKKDLKTGSIFLGIFLAFVFLLEYFFRKALKKRD